MKNIRQIMLIVIICMVAILIGAIILFDYKYKDKILPNISINGEGYSGLTKKEALEKLEGKTKSIREEGLTFSYQEKKYKAQLSEIGLSVDLNKTVSDAFGYGHDKGILENIKDELFSLNRRIDLWIEPKIDDAVFAEYLSKEIKKLEDPPKNFSYKYEDKEFSPVSARSGMVLDVAKLKTEISNDISSFKNEVIKIELVKKDPEVLEDAGSSALISAKNLLKNKIILKYNSSKWAIQGEELVPFVKFDATENASGTFVKVLGIRADKENIGNYLVSLVPQINQEPINAQLESKNGKVQVFSLDHDGIALNIEKSSDEIEKNLFIPDNYTSGVGKEIEIQLITENVKPEITIESIDNMGITALLSTGESSFAGSPNNRRRNIAVGAAKFQGVLIGPGDEFSFVKVLGEVGPKEGYLPELVIKKGETVPEYGGGLCQVSTTTFRAAVKAGLEITERQNHAYPVMYYSPQGTDATIYPPHPDLRFKNNTPAYILIQTRIEGNKLFFDFYGSDDGRKVETKDPVIYDRKSDGSLKSVWTQTVTDKDGNPVLEKKIYSIYKSPALYPHKNPLE